MKAGLLSLAVLAASANAQIRRGFRDRHHHHHHAPAKRALVVETQVQYVTATAPSVVVYVDANGNPISTGAPGAAVPSDPPPYVPVIPVGGAAPIVSSPPAYTPPAYTPPAYSPPAPAQPQQSSPPSPESSAPPAYTPPPAASTPEHKHKHKHKPDGKPITPPSYGGGGGSGATSGRGISYSPYNADQSCKSQDDVNNDFAKFDGYSIVRIYGTDCGQVPTVLNAAKAKGMKVFAGIFDIDQVATETQTLIDAAKNDWDSFDTISVGNELVNNGIPAASVISALNTAKGMLKTAGYTGPVVTVDTFVAMIANPSICEASDYAAANAHAFFDGNVPAEGAGAFVKEQADRVGQACGGKRVVITETGWPWQGESNGAAVPSRANQQIAIDSIKGNFTSDIFLFSAFDDKWKVNTAATFGCEQFWGFLG